MPCFRKMAKIKLRKKGFNFSFTKTFSIVSKIYVSLWIKSLCKKVDLRMHIKKQPAIETSREPVNCTEAIKCQSSVSRELTLFIKLLCSLNTSDCLSPGSEWREKGIEDTSTPSPSSVKGKKIEGKPDYWQIKKETSENFVSTQKTRKEN